MGLRWIRVPLSSLPALSQLLTQIYLTHTEMQTVTFVLTDEQAPIIVNHKVVVNPGTGGVKLTYTAIRKRIKEIKFFGKTYQIKHFIPEKKKQVIFLRPLKVNWDRQRNRLQKNLWGRPTHPLTNIWLILRKDYDQIKDIRISTETRNHMLVGFLKQGKSVFTITSNDVDYEFKYF